MVVEIRRVVAAKRRHHAGEDDREPVAARVDHSGLAQRRQQLGAALDRVLTGLHRALQGLGDRPVLLLAVGSGSQAQVPRAVGDVGHYLVGHLPRDGEDRPLGRFADGRIRAVRRVRERRADQRRVDQLAGPRDQLLRRTANQLGEDHAGVAPGPQERGAGHRVHYLLAPDLVDRALLVGALQAIELVEHRPQRERHVVSGVPVGDGKHVEVVDLITTRFQMRERPRHSDAKAQEVGVGHPDTSITFARGELGRRDPSARGPALKAVGDDAQRAFVTLPAFRQRVHTYTRLGALPTRILTFCRFGSKRRLVATIEWLRLWPNAGPLPQL